ncbi:MAG TPA: TetR/AcrR family transcriptional regulator [Rhodanobacteraceae bacterium]|nr:TetR/AcrR family transcriptional regulator [Rhodanobacteraceae bacterium]
MPNVKTRKPPRPARPTANRAKADEARKSRTRGRILSAAVQIVAEKGVAEVVIDDFIRAAGIARGTFYNYFKSTDEVLQAAAQALEDDLMVSIEHELAALDDPLARLTTGVRLWMRKARTDLAWCGFVARYRYHGALVETTVTNDLREGRKLGKFTFPSVAAARDLLIGTIREAMGRMADGPVSAGYADEIAAVVLRGLGVDEGWIRSALAKPVPAMRRASQTVRK